MGFLASLAARLIEWILVLGGKAIYDYSTELVERKKREKINDKNEKNVSKAMAEHDDLARKEAVRKLLNGEK
jgi:hypothetical protein